MRRLTSICLVVQIFLALLPSLGNAQSPTQTVHVIATTITQYYTETAPPAPLSTQYTSDLDFRVSILNSTNLYRYQHSASYLYWNTSLAEYAQNYSSFCLWEHSHNNRNGENLARGYTNVTAAVAAWGDEREMYDFDATNPTGFSEPTGHFTQLVWQSTQAVGCGWTDCDGMNDLQGVFLVCEYWPAGNLVGQDNYWFKRNVLPEIPDNRDSGFNELDATRGATGGTPTPTSQVPESTASSSGAAGNSGWEAERSNFWAALVVTFAALMFGFGMS